MADVKAVLGESTNDLGTLCTSKKINKWSRRKPVKSYALFYASPEDLERANYGLKVPVLGGTFERCVDKIINRDPSTLWEYVQPSGGRNSPYRLTDFEHYNHNASPPFPIPTKRGKHEFNLADKEITIGFDFIKDESDLHGGKPSNVTLAELNTGLDGSLIDLSEYSLAIAVRNPNSSAGTLRFESAKTLEEALEEGDDSIKVKADHLFQGVTYDCYPLFYRKREDGTFDIVPSDGLSFKMYCYKNEAGDLGGDDKTRPITISLNYVDGVPTGTVVIRNSSSSTVRITEIKLRFFKYVFSTETFRDEEYEEAQWDYGGVPAFIDIPAKGSKTLNIPDDGKWQFGNKPQYDPENETYVQFLSKNYDTRKDVNSEIENVWLIS